MSHTPGPWLFELHPSGGFDIETNPNDLGIYMVIASRNLHPKREQEMHANARLIAAAPELLEALEQMISDYASAIGIPSEECTGGPFEKARHAISKARGRA